MSEPTAFEAFRERFDSVQACAEALFQVRWPEGYRCPLCQHPYCYLTRTRRMPLYECKSCRHQTSLIAGTVMEGSSTSLVKWFQAIFLLSQPEGISSVRLSELLEVTYKTAWLISHKIRGAMHAAEQSEKLTGVVEVRSFGYGSILFGDAQQPIMIGASFDDEGNLEQIKLQQPDPEHVRVPERVINKLGYQSFIEEQVRSSEVSSYPFYAKFNPKLHPFQRGLKEWLNFTFCGIGAKHLQAYLDEFSFRINSSIAAANGAVFLPLLSWCASTCKMTYSLLTRARRTLPVAWKAYDTRGKWIAKHRQAWADV